MLKYTKDHEWLRLDGEVAIVGITDYAQKQLGDMVYVELPSIGATFAQGDVAATVESVKAASEVYAPVGGDVTAVNETLADEPGLVNSAPTGNGWLFKMKVANAAELDSLMDEQAYNAMIS
jgi:glycine cleavage system H protein